jgi:hypothetical protein
MLQNVKKNPCQPGAVHTWHETDMPKHLGDVRCWVNSGKHLLSLSFSGFDPGCVKTLCCCYDSPVILRGGIDEALR